MFFIDKKNKTGIINMKNMIFHTKEIFMQEKFVGICKVGERGQIVIPKQIRDAFGIKAGDSVVILSDINKGIAIVKSEVITDLTENTLNQ